MRRSHQLLPRWRLLSGSWASFISAKRRGSLNSLMTKPSPPPLPRPHPLSLLFPLLCLTDCGCGSSLRLLSFSLADESDMMPFLFCCVFFPSAQHAAVCVCLLNTLGPFELLPFAHIVKCKLTLSSWLQIFGILGRTAGNLPLNVVRLGSTFNSRFT